MVHALKFLPLFFLATWLVFAPAHSAPKEAKEKNRLKQVEEEIKQRSKARYALEKKAARLADQQKELQKKIIHLAARIKSSEARQNEIERDLKKLSIGEADMLTRLQKDRDRLAASLAALQKFEKQAPPALAVRPDDALAGLRGGLAMAGIVPVLQKAAERIKAQLDELTAIRQQMQTHQAQLKTEAAQAVQDKIQLAELLAEKKQSEAAARLSIAEEKREINRLARQARSLRDLVKKLESRRPPKDDGLKFRNAKGRLPIPVSGQFLSPAQTAKRNSEWGREGAYITTRAQAIVTAPFDATIQYAAPFRDYGTIVIMSVGRHYHLLLAGLDTLTTDVGQQVLAGEPIGRMANITQNPANPPLSQDRLTLYVEIRYKGQPVNAARWFKKR